MPDISEEFVGTCIIAYWFCKCYIKRRNFLKVRLYRMIHRVHTTFKLVQGHLNGSFLTGNFAWALSIYFANMGQKDGAKFSIFDPCTVCGKMLPVSGGVYLPAFWATLPYYSITCFLGHTELKQRGPKSREVLMYRPTQNCRSKRCHLGDHIPI